MVRYLHPLSLAALRIGLWMALGSGLLLYFAGNVPPVVTALLCGLMMFFGVAGHNLLQLQKQQEKQVQHLTFFQEYHLTPFIEIDLNQTVIYSNLEARRLFGPVDKQHPLLAEWEMVVKGSQATAFHREVLLGETTYQQIVTFSATTMTFQMYLTDITVHKKTAHALLESERRFREMTRSSQGHAQELALLERIRVAMSRELELTQVLQTTTEAICDVLGYIMTSIYLVEQDHLVMQHQVGYKHFIERLPLSQGIMGKVVRSGQSMLAHRDQHPEAVWAEEAIISEVCVPIRVAGQVVGVINVESTLTKFTEFDMRLIEAVSYQLAIAIQRAGLFDEVRAKARQYEDLYVLSQKQAESLSRQADELMLLEQVRSLISNKMDLEEVYQAVSSAVTEILNYECVGIVLLKDNLLELKSEVGYMPSQTEGFVKHEPMIRRVIEHAQGELTVWTQQERNRSGEGIGATICVPLVVDKAVTGVMMIESRQVLSETDVDLLNKVGAYVSLAIEQAQIYLALQTSESRYKGLIENASDLIYRTNRKGDFTFVNAVAFTILGYRDDEVMSFNYLDLIHPAHREAAAAFYMKQTREKRLNSYFEFVALHRDGRHIWIGQNVQLIIEQGRWAGFQAVARDITERKHMEETLLQQTDALLKANSELEQFAFVAAHDLQEPLRKIQAFGDRLSSKYKPLLDEQGQDYLTRMQSSASRMRALISDLLTFAKAGKEDLREMVDLNQILKGVSYDLQTRLEETHAHLQIGQLPVLEANPTQMRQLFQNLLGNALKFRQPDIAPVVSVRAEQLEDGRWRIRVQDNGIGFEACYKERIFRVFQRLHGREQYEGTGMGLAIVRKITDAHQATIDVQSEVGQGSTFEITFPTKPLARVTGSETSTLTRPEVPG